MKEDAEIIIGVDVDTQKIDKELEKILNKYSSKIVELQIESKDLRYLKYELNSLDDQIKSLSEPSDKLLSSFKNLAQDTESATKKVLVLNEELKQLKKEYSQAFSRVYSPKIDTSTISKELLNIGSNLKNILSIVLRDFSLGIYNNFSSTLSSLGNAIIRRLPNTTELLQDIFRSASFKIDAGMYYYDNLIKRHLNSTFDWIKGKAYNFFSPISNAAENLKRIISPAFDWIKEKASGLFSPVYSGVLKFKDLISSSFNWVLQEISKISPEINNISSSFQNIGSILAERFRNASSSISNSFENIKRNAKSASYHVDYFGRRIFNLLRNAFVFNVISRQFRGLSSLLGNLINRDTIFARTLMLVRANLIRAFAPIWQVVLPWIRLLGEGLLWLSKILINFINWLTGSKIKPVETFKEAKSVVGDFYKIVSPKKEMFNLVDPVKKIKNIKDGTKNVSKNTSKAGNNAKKLSKGLKQSAKESKNILASFDKLEVLKFDKNKLSKDPFGLDELKNKLIDEPSNSNITADLEVNVPSIEEQIADAINNIEDKPLDFTVNDDLGDQITTQINGLDLPPLNFKVSEESQSLVDNFKKKIIEFYNWIKPLIDAVSKFFGKVWESLQDTFSEIQKSPAVKWTIDKITDLKDNLVKMFNAMSENEGTIKTFRDIIIAIGAAFITYSIIKSVQKLFRVISSIGSLLMAGLTSPTGWVVIAVAALALIITHWEDIKKVAGEAWDKVKEFGNFLKGGFLNAWDTISTKISDVFESIKEFATKTWGWIDEHIISPIKNAFGFGNMFGNPNFRSQSITNLPHLAQGSILRGGDPFLTWINDQPRGQTNVEAPLNTIVDAFRQAMSEGSFGQSNINIEASGDMSSIVRLLNFKIQDENSRLGNAFVENIN